MKVGVGSILSVEEVALAVGQEIDHSSVKSAARMNRAVVLFLEKVGQANRAEEYNYRFVVRVDDFDYVLFATSSALKCFNCGEEGHMARACPSRRVLDAAPDPTAPPAHSRRQGVSSAVSGERENMEVVVEVTGESGKAGEVRDLTGVEIEVVCGLGELEKTGDGMSEISELGEAGDTRDMGQTGEQGVTDSGDKEAGRLEDAAAATDSDQEYTSDGSELSNTVTKGMRGPDLGIYFPDKLLFIQSASHWIKHRAASDLTDPEIFQLRKLLALMASTPDYSRTVQISSLDAFNAIQPSLLRGKMEGAGVDCHLAAWTTDYLTNRLQYVRLRDCESNVVACSTGARRRFSDDTAIVRRVSEGNKLEYREVITNFVAWCELNHLRINASKTKEVVIDFSRKASHIAPMNIQGLDIEIVEEYKYLGLFDSVVASVIFYAVVCWSCGSSERDRKRLNKLVRRAGSVLDCSLD
ncbi:hypothetical protein D4764_0247780 [Takifugu flavidus]|uniref:CCHC-type domain-containing protein n=1 Tax=Takifugu flavidus TaxID=433684 RepID=A0A5C6MNI8_9TELE|nr:hypothetical protein D4764_0247780 [Takifugu flavidus]